MWDVYIVDEEGVFKANSVPLTTVEAEHFGSLLDADLTFFLFPAGRSLVGFERFLLDGVSL
jgi:hypothetical protein